jgi:hypothetical protein
MAVNCCGICFITLAPVHYNTVIVPIALKRSSLQNHQ